jgi:YidC/Oxa1 family membrane protein insertase
MQQKMMKYMTVFIGLLFYKVASGLCLYFIASSLWGIAERKLLPKSATAGDAADANSAGSAATTKDKSSGAASTGPNGKPGKRKSKSKRKR